MISIKNQFVYSPDGDNTSADIPVDNNEKAPVVEDKKQPKKSKSLLQKIKEALQDWSNSDQRDLEYDDTKV